MSWRLVAVEDCRECEGWGCAWCRFIGVVGLVEPVIDEPAVPAYLLLQPELVTLVEDA